MTFITSIPLALRLAALFLLGAAVGGQLNRGIYRLAWRRRSIGPWSKPLPEALPRQWYDRLPIIGWLTLRREVDLHGGGFWIRPLLIELLTGIGYAALYLWEIGGGLLADPPGLAGTTAAVLHVQFVAHIALISLMVVATFIDFDEKTIPDAITVPGVLAALLLAAFLPAVRMLAWAPTAVRGAPPRLEHILLTTPWDWPAWLDGLWGLAYGGGCFVLWCVAMMPRVWYLKGGPVKTVQYFLGSISKRPLSRRYWCLAALGIVFIFVVWNFSGVHWPRVHWHSLLSALVGMAFGGALIWGVRVVGRKALAREAMGFGDVTLMAMIGAFLGWQAVLIVFFLAPFAALFIALAQLLLTRKSDIAFGPYLCLSTLLVIVGWAPIWNRYAGKNFILGWYIIWGLVVCLVLMGLMLAGWSKLRGDGNLVNHSQKPERSPRPRREKGKAGKKRGKKKSKR